MGTTCFHPTRRHNEVYIEIINQIHSESQKTDYNQNQDLYQLLKETVQRKGLLKKLMDNLSSHRNKITEAINHNYRIVIQNKTLQNHYAGLIIADCIISGVYKTSANKQLKLLNKNQNSQSQSEAKLLNSLSKNKSNVTEQSILRQVDMKFQQPYLRMIIYMLENQPKVYYTILQSLSNYCSSRFSKTTFSEEIISILNKIAKYIDKSKLMKKSTQTYYMLLSQLKQNIKDDHKDQCRQLKRFIILWLNRDQNQQTKLFLYEIIKIYVQRSIAKWQSNFIYEVIVEILDQYKFTNQAKILQQSILQMTKGEDLYQQFLKGLMLYLFAYASFSQDQSLIIKWNSVSWGVTAEQLKNKYPNIYSQQAKTNVVLQISQLIIKENFDINETIIFNRCSFLYVYLFNIYFFTSQNIPIENIQQQFFNVMGSMNLKSIHAALQIFIEQIKWNLSHESYQRAIIKIVRKIIQRIQVLNYSDVQTKYFIIINVHFPRNIKLQIIQLMGYIIQNLSIEKIQQQQEQICQFLYSLYQCLNIEQDNILSKHQFQCSSVSFLRSLYERNMKNLLMAYLENIYEAYPYITDLVGKFFTLAYIYEIREILSSAQNYFIKMKQIKQKIFPSCNMTTIKDLIAIHMRNNQTPSSLAELKNKIVKDNCEYDQNYQILAKFFSKEQIKQDDQPINMRGNSCIRSVNDQNLYDNSQENKSFYDIVQKINI